MAKKSSSDAGASKWPSLEEQLRTATVIHGSALEKLVKENQDFSMLHPSEANDRLGIPPWLRVYFRKNHPELDYSADNPSGGYPQYVKTAYEWMLLHQDLPVQQGPETKPERKRG
jgi:hypothetical protein